MRALHLARIPHSAAGVATIPVDRYLRTPHLEATALETAVAAVVAATTV
jgi:hypothetical protein